MGKMFRKFYAGCSPRTPIQEILMKTSEIKARLEEIAVEMEAIANLSVEQSRELTEKDEDQIISLRNEYEGLEKDLVRAEEIEKAMADIIAKKVEKPTAGVQPPVAEPQDRKEISVIPAVAKSQKSKFFDSGEDAFVSGMYLAALSGSNRAKEILNDQSVGTDDKGGYTVPTPLSNALINLLEEHGVARRVCRRIVMSAMTWDVPKLTDHATIYYPGEAQAITASDLTFAQVGLVAKKLAALVKMSTEVQEDSIISMMDTVVQSIAYSMAIAEDNNLFNGVSGGVNETGIKGAPNVADVDVASVAALALEDFTSAAVAIGNPIIGARNAWYMNSTLYHGPVRDLLNAAGGNTISDIEGGQRPTFLGYPVNFVSVLPGAAASGAGDLLAVFGDMSIGCYFGDRRSLGFKVLNELYAENDQVGVVATERIDVKVANPEVLSKITITG